MWKRNSNEFVWQHFITLISIQQLACNVSLVCEKLAWRASSYMLTLLTWLHSRGTPLSQSKLHPLRNLLFHLAIFTISTSIHFKHGDIPFDLSLVFHTFWSCYSDSLEMSFNRKYWNKIELYWPAKALKSSLISPDTIKNMNIVNLIASHKMNTHYIYLLFLPSRPEWVHSSERCAGEMFHVKPKKRGTTPTFLKPAQISQFQQFVEQDSNYVS